MPRFQAIGWYLPSELVAETAGSSSVEGQVKLVFLTHVVYVNHIYCLRILLHIHVIMCIEENTVIFMASSI